MRELWEVVCSLRPPFTPPFSLKVNAVILRVILNENDRRMASARSTPTRWTFSRDNSDVTMQSPSTVFGMSTLMPSDEPKLDQW